MKFLEVITNNWQLIVIWAVIIAGVVFAVTKFFKISPSQQLKRIKLALLGLVTEAEKMLGSETGKIKRSEVYNAVVNKFPVLSIFLSEGKFDELLNSTLEQFRNLLQTNPSLYNYVYGQSPIDAIEIIAEEVFADEDYHHYDTDATPFSGRTMSSPVVIVENCVQTLESSAENGEPVQVREFQGFELGQVVNLADSYLYHTPDANAKRYESTQNLDLFIIISLEPFGVHKFGLVKVGDNLIRGYADFDKIQKIS